MILRHFLISNQKINVKVELMSSNDQKLGLDLPSESEVMSSWNGDPNNPVVSICCSTFNHVSWISQALNGFLTQRTNFPFEIIIRDDASTDGALDVIRAYAKKYPKIIKHKIEYENMFSKGVRSIHIFPELASGKYVALCEGDDFWLSNDKLQKQVELLESNNDAVMSVALTKFCRQTGNSLIEEEITRCPPNNLLDVYSLQGYYFHTSTYVIRREIFSEVIEKYFMGHATFGDTALRAILISMGNFVVLPEVVSVYRITGDGIWTSLDEDQRLSWELRAAQRLAEVLPGVHLKLQRQKIYNIRKQFLKKTLKSHDASGFFKSSFLLFLAMLRYRFL